MSRWLRVLSVACVLVVVPVQPAKACSCAIGDPRDMFADADGAFVGTFVESHPVEDPSSSAADTVYTFLLDEEHKGELGEPGDTVEVHAPLSGASCGIEATPGEQYGLFLHVRDDGAWASSLCRQVSPETMREAASPLPAPTSDGPVRFVAGGSFGDTQTMFLDAQGETVAYGAGDRDVTHVAVCKSSARILEVGTEHSAAPMLFVRDVSSREVVSSVRLPMDRGWLGGVHCRSADGARSVVFASDYAWPRAESVLFAVDGDDVDVLHRGSAQGAAFSGRFAYLREGEKGRRVTRVALDDGAERFVARLPGRVVSELAPSPDGGDLAFVTIERTGDGRAAKIGIVELPGGEVRTRAVKGGVGGAQVLWSSSERIALFSSSRAGGRVFDPDLRTRARFGRWSARATVVVGTTAYGVDYEGRLFELKLPRGSSRLSRRLPSPIVYDLAVL